MDSTIVLGDTHGSTYWKEVVKEHPDDRYIFLGDYLDPYERIPNENLISNLEDIIRLKKENPDKVILLLGNHDLHYFMTDIYQSTRYNWKIASEVSKLFLENIDLFQYAYQEDKYIFTHAGIAHQWFTEDFKGDLKKNIAEQLNFPSSGQIKALCRCGEWRGGDRGYIGGIFWADISELDDPLHGYTQIVGHNRVDEIRDVTTPNGRIIFCDCLYNKKYLRI